jgi:probable rRNA maturation factor
MILIKNFTRNKFDQKYLDKVAERTLQVIKIKKSIEISLVIVGEKRIRSLNKKYRGMDKITDVLSFGNEEDEIKNKSGKSAKFINPPVDVLYLGEIFICYPKTEKQAKKKNHSVKKELSILLIHGILHLAGYDHKEGYEKSEMKVIEEKILTDLRAVIPAKAGI